MSSIELVPRIGKIKPVTALINKPDMTPDGRIAQVFLNVDLRNSHDGLLAAAKKRLANRRVDLDYLPQGTYLTFINELGTRFKILAPSGHDGSGRVVGWVVAYYKSAVGRIDVESILNVPRVFNGKNQLKLNNGARDFLTELLKKRRIRQVKELNQ